MLYRNNTYCVVSDFGSRVPKSEQGQGCRSAPRSNLKRSGRDRLVCDPEDGVLRSAYEKNEHHARMSREESISPCGDEFATMEMIRSQHRVPQERDDDAEQKPVKTV